MTNEEILTSIEAALQNVTGNSDISLSAESKASDVEEWDSLANVRLFIEMEGVFGVRFTATDMDGLKDVGEMVSLVKAKLA